MRRRPGFVGLIIILVIAIVIFAVSIAAFGYFRNGILDKGGAGGGVCGNIPQPYLDYFTKAGAKSAVQPSFIAAIFVGEHRSVKDSSYKNWPDASGPWASSPQGAKGPFQFEVTAKLDMWAAYGQDGDGDGVKDVQNLADASSGAANLLAHSGAGNNTTDLDILMDVASRYNSGRNWDEGQKIPLTKNYVENLVMPAFKAFQCPVGSPGSPGQGNDGVPLFKQGDPRWGDLIYGFAPHTISAAGCGPTAAAMVLSYAGVSVDPPTVANFSYQHGDYQGKGTSYSLFDHLTKNYNLTGQRLKSWDDVTKYLQNHQPVVVAGKGSGPFTANGHFIVLTGIDNNNLVRINNPANTGDGPYPLSLIEAEVKADNGFMYYLGK